MTKLPHIDYSVDQLPDKMWVLHLYVDGIEIFAGEYFKHPTMLNLKTVIQGLILGKPKEDIERRKNERVSVEVVAA